MNTSEQRRKTFERLRAQRAPVKPVRGIKDVTIHPDMIERDATPHPGGRRWGYPLAFKMEAIRMVREQGLSVAAVQRKLDIAESTLKKWLDYYDLKRIPPKGANEYPENPQAGAMPEPVAKPQETAGGCPQETPLTVAIAQASERKEQIRNAIDLLKQAVDLLHTATRSKQTTQEPTCHV